MSYEPVAAMSARWLSIGHRHPGKRLTACLLRKPVAEGVVAEEGHDANFAVETL
jgi:hypothetical protein